jgi:Asp-tRNA(Asn)/Glu-tRNA(Gln) amidotransferase A subunit family amidase
MPESVYDLKSVSLPRLTGAGLNIFVSLLETGLGNSLLVPGLLKNAGIAAFRKLEVSGEPTFQPFLPTSDVPQGPTPDLAALLEAAEPRPEGFAFASIADYAGAYRTGRLTPLQTAERLIEAIRQSDQSDPPLRAIIALHEDDLLEQARQSTQRWQQERPLSPLDGVPVAVKDEVDLRGYPTSAGTSFLGSAPALEDCTAAGRLRQAGALLPGKANMHEIGIGVTGFNAHHGTTRNPYHPGHYTGGSSSGPATAVASGLVPAALGADGGGSIRIPASFCGVVGLKPTYGRVSEHGAYPLCWSVAFMGPLAASARDAALAYAVMAGADPKDANTLRQPPASLLDFENTDLHSLKLGIFRPWFEHASDEVVKGCTGMLEHFSRLGAEVVEIQIPDLEALRVAHLVTITSEMNASLARYYQAHKQDYSLEVRSNLALALNFTSRDYVKAQQVRTQAMHNFGEALKQVDVILTPSTGVTAPLIRPDVLPLGESDLSVLTEIMRFAVAANMTGLPAISFPVGYDSAGLPVGMQAIGRAWREDLLLRLAHASEAGLERRKPQVFYDLLG